MKKKFLDGAMVGVSPLVSLLFKVNQSNILYPCLLGSIVPFHCYYWTVPPPLHLQPPPLLLLVLLHTGIYDSVDYASTVQGKD